MNKKNIVLTITGPSLSGKSTMAQKLLEKFDNFQTVVTHTTRDIRDGEINGHHYHFVTKEEFKKMIKNGEMVEFAEVGPKDNTQFYGTSLSALNKVFSQEKTPILVIEPNGAKNVRNYCKKHNILTYQVFISNHPNILFKRFLQRFKDDNKATVENYAKRMENMVHVEPKEWILPALNGDHEYDIVFTEFDTNTTENVLQRTVEGLNKKLNPEEKHKNSLPIPNILKIPSILKK